MILVVEDNPNDAALIVRELEKQLSADSIRHVTDGTEAIDFVHRCDGEPVQLILLNLQLAGQSGLDVLKQLRGTDSSSHIPVVMMNGSDTLDDIARSYDLGANSVISKSDRGDGFAETLSQIAPYWLELNHPYIRPGAKR